MWQFLASGVARSKVFIVKISMNIVKLHIREVVPIYIPATYELAFFHTLFHKVANKVC